MAASRMFLLLGHSIIRNPRTSQFTPSLKFSTVCLPHSLRFKRCISSAVTLDSDVSAVSDDAVAAHPWPEWINFVDQLKAKGYINQSGDEKAGVYTEVKVLKDACLSFGRDRFDIFNSLPTSDIQAVVEKGCPNLGRKSVNSAKRLRAHLQLDEGDVCSSCSLRGSCDRAYVLLTESETGARTVDVVRILLNYAVDPLVVSGEVESLPPGRELFESSARRLLSMLVELGETAVNPDLPKPASVGQITVKAKKKIDMKPGDWVCSECSFVNFARNTRCMKCKENGPPSTLAGRDGVEMKKGDWNCPQCNFMNFSRNTRCLKCKTNAPANTHTGRGGLEMKKGDWNCPQCNFINFARNTQCLKCKTNAPESTYNGGGWDEMKKRAYNGRGGAEMKRGASNGGGGVEMKKGDWNCPQCSAINFARNQACFRCEASRPPRQLRPGDWECLDCDFMNFAQNTVCKKCNVGRPV